MSKELRKLCGRLSARAGCLARSLRDMAVEDGNGNALLALGAAGYEIDDNDELRLVDDAAERIDDDLLRQRDALAATLREIAAAPAEEWTRRDLVQMALDGLTVAGLGGTLIQGDLSGLPDLHREFKVIDESGNYRPEDLEPDA